MLRYLIGHTSLLLAIAFTTLHCASGSKATNDSTVVVAKVNQTKITASDFSTQLEQVAKFRVTRLFNEDQKKAILIDMINFELLFQKLQAEGFLQRNDAVRRLAVQEYLLERVNQRYTPTESEIRTHYEKNQENLDRICIRHILVSDEKKAHNLIAKVKNFEDFATLASQESIDGGSAARGGDLGCIAKNVGFVPEFKEAAFALKKSGDITLTPVKSSFGYHIILLAQDLRGIENNRDTIRAQLANSKRQEILDELLVELKEKAQIETAFENLVDINLPIAKENP